MMEEFRLYSGVRPQGGYRTKHGAEVDLTGEQGAVPMMFMVSG